LIPHRLILISINISASPQINKVKKLGDAREQQPRRRVWHFRKLILGN